jgi:hypothetical protein
VSLVDAIDATRDAYLSRDATTAAPTRTKRPKIKTKTTQRLVSWRRSASTASDAATDLEQRDQVVDIFNFVVRDENLRVHQFTQLSFLIIDEVRAYVTSVDGQALRELDLII